jgi:cold shock CspA family protein/ribosome-associated translation inhibitor RaiA
MIMQVPLELSMQDVDNVGIREEVEKCASKLDKVCERIISCRVAVERPNHSSHRPSNGYRVRVEVTVPPRHDVVVTREQQQSTDHRDVSVMIHDAFDAAARQLRDLNERQHQHVKQHPQQEAQGLISRLFQDYGFLRTLDDREIYFHRNSVVKPDFEDLHEGDGVAFAEEMGEEGPQASTLRVVSPVPRRDAP